MVTATATWVRDGNRWRGAPAWALRMGGGAVCHPPVSTWELLCILGASTIARGAVPVLCRATKPSPHSLAGSWCVAKIVGLSCGGPGVVVAGDSTGALFILRLVDVMRKAEAQRLDVGALAWVGPEAPSQPPPTHPPTPPNFVFVLHPTR